MHACARAHDDGEKRNVLIVSVLLPIAVNFMLCSKTQRHIEVLGPSDAIANRSVARGQAAGAVEVVRDGQVEDQAQAARLITQVAADFHVCDPLACVCRYTMLRAHRVSGRAEQQQTPTIQSCTLVAPE